MGAAARVETDPPGDAALNRLADLSAGLGYEIVDIAGFLDTLDEDANAQLSALGEVRGQLGQVVAANEAVHGVVAEMGASTHRTLEAVGESITVVRDAGARSQTIARWVQDLTEKVRQVAASLQAVQSSNSEIADIARHVNILAINAKIEAARAGDSGRGFGVVAEAINDLSRKTATAAEEIASNLGDLSGWVDGMQRDSGQIAGDASAVIDNSSGIDRALNGIAEGVRAADAAAGRIQAEAERMQAAADQVGPAVTRIDTAVGTTIDGLAQARARVNALIDRGEAISQASVAAGGVSTDGRFIARVQADAARLSALLEAAVAQGRITREDLFDHDYRPIEGSNPQQFMTRFTGLTDRLFPEVQEAALMLDPRVVFCVAIDTNGYLPTHNRKFSQPQRNDVAWNTANCRNRRIFDDRVGLKAGRNQMPFLLQVYRRDMGGGSYAMMKDVSAPIRVGGKHWGALRLAYYHQ